MINIFQKEKQNSGDVKPISTDEGKAIQIIAVEKDENYSKIVLREKELQSILEKVDGRKLSIQAIAG